MGHRDGADRGTRKWVCGYGTQGGGQKGAQGSGYAVMGHRGVDREGHKEVGMQ